MVQGVGEMLLILPGEACSDLLEASPILFSFMQLRSVHCFIHTQELFCDLILFQILRCIRVLPVLPMQGHPTTSKLDKDNQYFFRHPRESTRP